MTVKQKQKVGNNSVGIQIGGDLVVNVENKIITHVNKPKTKQFKDGAWIYVPDNDINYQEYISAVTSLVAVDDYDHANSIFWKILYNLGYKGLWKERILLSKMLYGMSIEKGDFKNAGLILNRGVAYTFHENGFDVNTVACLKRSFDYFKRTNYRIGKASCISRYAEILCRQKKYNRAKEQFKKAIKYSPSNSIDQYQIYLKAKHLLTLNGQGSINERIDNLLLLKDKFFEIKDYREGIMHSNIGRLFLEVNDIPNARYHLEKAKIFFKHKVDMPRNRIKAEKLLIECV